VAALANFQNGKLLKWQVEELTSFTNGANKMPNCRLGKLQKLDVFQMENA
jgi:hypothetical protein